MSNGPSSAGSTVQWEKIVLSEEGNLDTGVIEGFRDSIASTVQRQRNDLEKLRQKATASALDPDDIREYVDHLGDQNYELDQIADLGHELAVVALFKKIEIRIKSLVGRYFLNANTAQLFKIAALKSAYPWITTVADFSAFDELRALNNCIKHSGKVSTELAAYPNWTVRKKLENLEAAYDRLSPRVEVFVRAFAQECYRRKTV